MGTRKLILVLFNSVAALLIVEGVYYVVKMLVTLLADQQLEVDLRMFCLSIGAKLLSKKRVWGIITLLYAGLAFLSDLYVLKAVLLFLPDSIKIVQITRLPIRQPTPEIIFSILLFAAFIRLYEIVVVSVFLLQRGTAN